MYRSEFEYCTRDIILQKHIDLLEKLSDARIFCVCKDNESNDFYLTECCDDWFTHTLTKDECLELSDLFKEIAAKI